MDKNKITNFIKQEYQKIIKTVEKKQVLGVFLYHKTNLETVKSVAELDIFVILYPTIEELALNKELINSRQERTDKGSCFYLDFRIVPELLCGKNDYLRDIFFSCFYQVNPTYQKLFNQLKDKLNKIEVLEYFFWKNTKEFNENWTTLFEHYLQCFNDSQDQLFNVLTKTEEKALAFCLAEIGKEGVISISEAIRKSGISRPVFTGLLEKLSRYGGAEVKNMGVKGTYINFCDNVLSKFEIL